jgi:DNA repair protein RadC
MKDLIVAEIKVSYKNPTPVRNRVKVTSSQQAASIFKHHWDVDTIELQEEFKAMYLNNAGQVIGIHSLSKGSSNSTVIDGKTLFGIALKARAQKIILCHNHPSGNLSPSLNDMDCTSKYISAARYLEMEIYDHIILTKEGYYSFADEGIL